MTEAEVYCSPDENLTDIGKFKMTEKVNQKVTFSQWTMTSSIQMITLNPTSIGFNDLRTRSSQGFMAQSFRSTNPFKLGRITRITAVSIGSDVV